MKQISSMTATAQGIVEFDNNGNAKLQRYDKSYQAKSAHKPKHIADTAENIEKIYLNLIQRSMYRRLMYGIKEFAPEQVASMSPYILSKIVDDYKKAKQALHVLKAKKYFDAETKLINAIFPHVKVGDNDFDWFMDLPKSATLRSLGISTKEVIEEFIKRRLLPQNFFTITPENVEII